MQKATVLVIEDEPIVRMAVANDLVDAGFDVVEASNAEEALRILGNDVKIAAIFTDIDMPGEINGLRLAWIVRDRWPPVHIIVTSGHKRPTQSDLPIKARFFPKPYMHQTVIDALEAFLT